MIKINLAPKVEKKKTALPKPSDVSKNILLKLLLPLGLTILLVAGTFAYMEMTKDSLKKDIDQNRKTLAQLQKKIEEVRKIEELNKEIETKTKILEDLQKMKTTPVMLLNTLAKRLPEGVWLTGINYDNKLVSLEGMAFSNLNIVAFVDNLKAVNDFQNVNLIESQQTEFDKVPVYKFIIKFDIKG